jgi:hypothetical protein
LQRGPPILLQLPEVAATGQTSSYLKPAVASKLPVFEPQVNCDCGCLHGSSTLTSVYWWLLPCRKCTPILLQLAEAAAKGQTSSYLNPRAAAAFVGKHRRRRQLLQLDPRDTGVTVTTSSSSSNAGRNASAAPAVTIEDMRSLLRDPFLNSTEALAEHYDGLMCAQGYSSRLCTQCVFPGGWVCDMCQLRVSVFDQV